MAWMAYRLKHAKERHTASLLVSGFTKQLKNWWDNALTLQDKVVILEHTINFKIK